MTGFEAFKKDITMSEVQMERAFKFWCDNAPEGAGATFGQHFEIQYQFSSVGNGKVMKVGEKSFWIDELDDNGKEIEL